MTHSFEKSRLRATALLCFSLLAAALPSIASAALGEPDDSVLSDQAQMKGSLKLINRALYKIHEMQLPSGTSLRQYVGSDGKVFAVTWSGPAMPDLRQSLGRYFDAYVAGAQANRRGHRQLRFQTADLIVHAGGHMRSFTGVAFLASAVPAGVSPEELN